MKILRTAGSLMAAACALTLSLPLLAAHAAETVEIRPAQLERGPDVAIPHVEGRSVVDGERRIEVGPRPTLLGLSGTSYVVGQDGDILRVRRNGEISRIAAGDPGTAVVSGDGEHLAVARFLLRSRDTRIAVHEVRSGQKVASRVFAGSVTPLDMEDGRLVLGGWGPDRTFWWDALGGSVEPIKGQVGYAADISGGVLATYTRDPYQDGCSVLSPLDQPRKRLWRSCEERVTAFSPGIGPGSGRLATVHILADGLGPNEVHVRKVGGRRLASYTTDGWFGLVEWESDTALLMDTSGRKKAATVRCVVGNCERASRLRDREDL